MNLKYLSTKLWTISLPFLYKASNEALCNLSLISERVGGIEPLFQPWEGCVMPLYHTRINKFFEPAVGIEPTTFALRKHCSASELRWQTPCPCGYSIIQYDHESRTKSRATKRARPPPKRAPLT